MSTRPIRFLHRGAVVEVADAAPTRTVLEWLREDARCTGTKEGCAEGDCGACMVVVGAAQPDGTMHLRPMNACIQFLPTLDGQALFTVEDLATPDGPLHPVQQALVDCHGSQCGFCTPGFVMSLWALYQAHTAAGTRPTREDVLDALSGNLCRCTGYRPILDAAQRMFDAPELRVDQLALAASLRALLTDTLLSLGREPACAPDARYDAPRTLDALAALVAAHPQATLLAGSTDIGLWVTKQFRPLPHLIYLGGVAELKNVSVQDGHLHIGAGASLEAAWQALAQHWPALRELGLRFAALPLRLVGTMGGNLANGSPIGDSAPALMALDARLLLRQGERLRSLALDGFYTGYMKNQLEPGEFVQAIAVPLPQTGDAVRGYKIAKRHDCDISAVCAGLRVQLHGGFVHEARFAFGGMAATVSRAARTEAAVLGQPWTQATAHAAADALGNDFSPMTDLRASAAYRLDVSRRLLQRFWLETRADDPLPAAAVNVWSASV